MYGRILITVFGLVLFSACSQVSEVIGGNDLLETEWVLTSLNGEPLLEGTNITLAFYQSELSGFAGCNGYGSQYELIGNDEIKILEIASQAEGCLEPEGVLDQESEYLKQLLNIKQYRIESGVLTLSNPEFGQALVYSLREAFEIDPASLDDIQWNLVPSEGFPLIDGSKITISFSNGVIEGFGGCRDYEGEYEAEGDGIVFPVMMMIGELCDDLDLQIQEAKFTTWLELSTHYRIEGDQLELYLATGDSLFFEGLE
jgi:heat shock protein HslJ